MTRRIHVWLALLILPGRSDGKAWIERRLRWLIEEFGDDAFLNAPNVLPTNQFFPTKATLRKISQKCWSAGFVGT